MGKIRNMATLNLSAPRGMITYPSRAELRAMLERPSVIITAILATALVIVSFVAGLVFLAVTGHSTEALTLSLIVPVVGVLVACLNRLAAIKAQVEQVQHNTNGTTTRLLDAALPTPTDAPR